LTATMIMIMMIMMLVLIRKDKINAWQARREEKGKKKTNLEKTRIVHVKQNVRK